MAAPTENYLSQVERIESALAPYAKKSFEPFSQQFVDGGVILDFYQRQWKNPGMQLKLANRTPLQLERDRILYSNPMRKQTEKYHVLYSGPRRIVRNYITHTMRVAQVARSICRGMGLNGEFAEAIALGSKVGALPFIHASKDAIGEWVKRKVLEIDEKHAKNDPLKKNIAQQLEFDAKDFTLPSWMSAIRSDTVFRKVQMYIPWAAGKKVELPYSSGQESYWLLCTNPLTLESHPTTFAPETMFGIWRHSRGIAPEKHSFIHKCKLVGATGGYHEIRWDHCTYEAVVVQYADDITWVIENLNDANSAALISNRQSVYEGLNAFFGEEVPEQLHAALGKRDSGAFYTYFIADFVRHSQDVLKRLRDGCQGRVALREGRTESMIGLSPEAEAALDKITQFLYEEVFTEPRTKNRTEMLKTVSLACVELLYNGAEDVVSKFINDKAALEQWPRDKVTKALDLINDPIHRVQLAVDILSDMGDQEIYDFVGIQSL